MSVRLSRRPLSVPAAYRELGQGPAGGIAIFLGRVRPDRVGARIVRALDYEADEGIALAAMHRIERGARARWGADEIVLHHRIGRLRVGEISVIAGAAAAHRADAFRSARWIIERLKSDVPIWKQNVLSGDPR